MHVLMNVCYAYVCVCVHTFWVLIMLKINRAKRSDDAPRQWQRWTGTNRERVGRERGTRNTLSLTLVYLRPSDKRGEESNTQEKSARKQFNAFSMMTGPFREVLPALLVLSLLLLSLSTH